MFAQLDYIQKSRYSAAYKEALENGKSEDEARTIAERAHDQVNWTATSGIAKAAAWGTVGAAVGSIIPVVGTAAGAVIGGAAGLVHGVFKPKTLKNIADAAKHFLK